MWWQMKKLRKVGLWVIASSPAQGSLFGVLIQFGLFETVRGRRLAGEAVPAQPNQGC